MFRGEKMVTLVCWRTMTGRHRSAPAALKYGKTTGYQRPHYNTGHFDHPGAGGTRFAQVDGEKAGSSPNG